MARLDVDQSHGDLSAQLGFSSELVFAWGRDTSGAVLRDPREDQDIYGFSSLMAMMDREAVKAQVRGGCMGW